MSSARTFVGFQLERSSLARRALHFNVDEAAPCPYRPSCGSPSSAASRIQAVTRGRSGRALSAERRARHLRLEDAMIEQRCAQVQRDKACLDAGIPTDPLVLSARASCEGAFRAVVENDEQLHELDEIDSHLLGGTGFGDGGSSQSAVEARDSRLATSAMCAPVAAAGVVRPPPELPPAELSEAASRVLAFIETPEASLAPAADGIDRLPVSETEGEMMDVPRTLRNSALLEAVDPSAAPNAESTDAPLVELALKEFQVEQAPPELLRSPPSSSSEPVTYPSSVGDAIGDEQRASALGASLRTIGDELEYGLSPILEGMDSAGSTSALASASEAGKAADDLVLTLIRWIKARDEASTAELTASQLVAEVSELTSEAARDLLGKVTPASSAIARSESKGGGQAGPLPASQSSLLKDSYPSAAMIVSDHGPASASMTGTAGLLLDDLATGIEALSANKAEEGGVAHISPMPSSISGDTPTSDAAANICQSSEALGATADGSNTGPVGTEPSSAAPAESLALMDASRPSSLDTATQTANDYQPTMRQGTYDSEGAADGGLPKLNAEVLTDDLEQLLQSANLSDLLTQVHEAKPSSTSAANLYEAAFIPPKDARPLGVPRRLWHDTHGDGTLATTIPALLQELEDAMQPFSSGGPYKPKRTPGNSLLGSSQLLSVSGEHSNSVAGDNKLTAAEVWLEENREYVAALRHAAIKVQGEEPFRQEVSDSFVPGMVSSVGTTSHASTEEVFLQLRKLGDGVVESVDRVTSRLNPRPEYSPRFPVRKYSALGPFPPPSLPSHRPQVSAAATAAARLATEPLPSLPLAQSRRQQYGRVATALADVPAQSAWAGPAPMPAPFIPDTRSETYVEPPLPPMPPLPPLGDSFTHRSGSRKGTASSFPYGHPMLQAPVEVGECHAAPPTNSSPWFKAQVPSFQPENYQQAMDDFRSRIDAQRAPVWQPSTPGAQAIQAAVEQSRWRAAAFPVAGPDYRAPYHDAFFTARPNIAAALSSYDKRVQHLAASLVSASPHGTSP